MAIPCCMTGNMADGAGGWAGTGKGNWDVAWGGMGSERAGGNCAVPTVTTGSGNVGGGNCTVAAVTTGSGQVELGNCAATGSG